MVLLCGVQKWKELLRIQASNQLAVHQCLWIPTEVFQSLLCPSVSLHTVKLSWGEEKETKSRTGQKNSPWFWKWFEWFSPISEYLESSDIFRYFNLPCMITLIVCWWTTCGLELSDYWIVPSWCLGAEILLDFIAASHQGPHLLNTINNPILENTGGIS